MVKPVHQALPANLRGVVVLLAMLSALAVALLGISHYGSHGPDAFDRAVSSAVQVVWPNTGRVAHLVDHLAAPVSAAVIVALLVIGCLVARRWRLAVVAAIGPLSAAAGTIVLKPIVMRTIHGENLAFPSGHTAFATAVGLLCGLLWVERYRPGRVLGIVVLIGLGFVSGVGMAVDQVALDAHYSTDTVGGFCTATTVVLATALLVDYLADWRSQLTARQARQTATSSRSSPPAE